MRNVKDAPIIEFMSPPGVAAYTWVFEKNPEADDKGVNWYGTLLKFPKDKVGPGGEDEEDFKAMRRQFMAAARQGWPNGNGDDGKFTNDFGSPLRDGDKFDKANNRKKNEELFGFYYINFKTKNPPGVGRITSDGELVDAINKEDFYSGCIARVSGVTFPYDNAGNEGVGVRMTNCCKMADGERIGGKPSTQSQFAKFGKTAPKGNDSDADDLL